MKSNRHKHLLHRVQTKLILTYSIIVVAVFMIVYSVSMYMLKNQVKKELLGTDKEALTQISNSIVLMTDLMVEKMIAIYSNDYIQWFFAETSDLGQEEFKKWSVESYDTARRLKEVRKTLRSNAMLYTLIDGSNVLVTNKGAIFTFWSSDFISEYTMNISKERQEWDDYFIDSEWNYKWEIVQNRKSMNFQECKNENTLACVYCYRSPISGEQKGYICMNIDADELNRCYSSYLDEDMGNSIYIFDGNGEQFSGLNPYNTKIPQEAVKELLLLSDNEGVSFVYEDKAYIYNCMKIPSRNWILINQIPISCIDKNNSAARDLLFVIFVIGGLGACGLVVVFTYKFSYRIKYLKGLMENAAGEKYDLSYEVNYYDEFDEIGESFNRMVGDIKNYTAKLVQEEKEKKINEINYLHAQINTHFLYNIFNSIKMLSLLNRNKDINNVITSLSKLLRGTLDVSDEMLTIEEELENVKHYFKIEEIIHLDEVVLNVNCPEELECCMIPKLLLQPIVENSFIHGFKDVHYKKEINIDVSEDSGVMIITVKDNGCGISGQQLMNITDYRHGYSRSIGLKNIEERIRILYGQDYGIDVESEWKMGTTVTLRIPLITRQDYVMKII